MRKFLLLSIASILVSLLAIAPAEAVVVELLPTFQSGPLGAGFDVDLVVSRLGEGVAPSLSGFDFDVTYDSAILAPTGVSFGELLGAPGVEADYLSFAGAGVVDLLALSFFLSPFDLDALQPASFVLATLSFDGIGAGTSALAFTQTVLTDGFGDGLPVLASGGSIRVVDAQQVPEPGAALLVGLGLVAALGARPYRDARRNQNGPRRLRCELPSTSTVQK